jgi:glutaredoxin/uncharacterized damage-inducible protein DinB
MDGISVYWTPGCSSCVKLKEFLTRKGVAFRPVNVAVDPAAMDFLASIGARSVPVVVRGEDFTFAQSLEDVANFVGISHSTDRLAPAVLMARWQAILDVAGQAIARLPPDALPRRPVAERPRTIRDLVFHIYQVPDAFLQTVTQGLEDWTVVANVDAPEAIDIPSILAYGAEMRAGVTAWWDGLEDRSCNQPLKMFYGTHPLHAFLERSVWHTAQHTRQLLWWSGANGIAVRAPLAPEILHGLPMPDGLWE